MKPKGKIGVLISGRGSHLKNLIGACATGSIDAEVAVVISNNPEAPGLQYARETRIESSVISHHQHRDRQQYDAVLVQILQHASVDLICLAGFMRLLSPVFIDAFPGRIMNVHPSLLPAFPGLHAQRQALEYGAKVTGCTVHFVDHGLDSGPVILQKTLEIRDNDTEESLSDRLLPLEHQTYREAVGLFFQNRLKIDGRHVIIS